jgi:hypothetical protein
VSDKLDHLAFGDAADLIEMQAALALDFFGLFRGAEKGVSDHGDGGKGSATHGQQQFPI